MKDHMIRAVCALLIGAAITVTSGTTVRANSGIGVEPGEQMPDFTVALTDGSSATLSELLMENELVVLNIFATWCGPCEMEFPEMEEVYRDNMDKMVIVSVSGDPSDTLEMVSEYKDGHALSFPMGVAGNALDFLSISGFPTTIFIDRNQMVGFIKVGAFVEEDEFEDRVDNFISHDYDGNPIATEEAVNLLPYMLGYFFFGSLVMIVGRWAILKKAGKKGWHSLIPVLNIYEEFSVCWKGWMGLVEVSCFLLIMICNYIANTEHLSVSPGYLFLVLMAIIIFAEGQKLARSFGKGTFWGILLFIPGLREIFRVVLGFGPAEYNEQ